MSSRLSTGKPSGVYRECLQMRCRTGSATGSSTHGWRKLARAQRHSTRSTGSATSAAAASVPSSSSRRFGNRRERRNWKSPRLVDLANRALDERANPAGRLDGENDADPLEDILSVGTSAGGARAKAVLAWNPKTGEFRSGQLDADAGFEHWLLKFDGVSNNRDKELADPQGYGKIEYAYSAMARAASITMSECRLHHEGGRSHFMTKRFDRDDTGRKSHMQSLGAMQHFDFNDPSAYSYEQAITTIRDLDLGDGCSRGAISSDGLQRHSAQPG